MNEALRSRWPALVVAGLLVAMYAPTILWMIDRWFAPGSFWSHGVLVAPVAAVWGIARMRAARPAVDSPSMVGLGILVAGLALQSASVFLAIHFTSALSGLVVAAGLVLYLRGPRTLGILLPPGTFLVFMIPLPLIVVAHLTLRLKLLSAAAGVFVIRHLGIDAVQEGSFIAIASERLLVGDACSGLRSLVALLALGFLLVQRFPVGPIGKGIALASVVPLAMIGNLVRVVILCLVAARFGADAVRGGVHFLAGLAVYLVTLAGLVGGSALASRRFGVKEAGE
jgi:exosortase